MLRALVVAGGLLLGLSAASGRIGRVETLSRESYIGHVRFESNAVVVVNAERLLWQTVPLTNLARLLLETEPGGGSIAPPVNADASRVDETGLPPSWREQTVGSVSRVGGVTVEGRLWRVTTAGTNIFAHSDAFHFVYGEGVGESELIASVVALEQGTRGAKAGLMIRESLAADAVNVAFLLTRRSGAAMQWRLSQGADTVCARLVNFSAPGWVRLHRDGNTVSAYGSRNGRHWRLVNRLAVSLPEKILIGLAVCGGGDDSPARATFSDLRQGRTLPLTSYQPRLELRSGSVVMGPFGELDETAMRFPSGSWRQPVSSHAIANLRFQTVPSVLSWRLRVGQPGVLLNEGQFIEGESTSITGHKLTFRSVLLGERRYDVNHDVMAVVFNAPHPLASAYEVRSVDGSWWRGDLLEMAANEVILQERALGRHRIPFHQIAEICIPR